MANYIASFDPEVHANRDSVLDEVVSHGGAIIKDYAFALTYGIEIDTLDNLGGVMYSELDDKPLNSKMVFDINHLNDIVNTPESNNAWNPINTGSGEIVYLIDTGIDSTHNELPNSIDNFYTNFDDYNDAHGHGTAVASLIVGKNIGVSPDAVLKNVRLFEQVNGTITVGEIVDALDAVLEDHLASAFKVKVVCMPWTIDKNLLVDNKLSELMDNGLLVVAAAGNDGIEVDSVSPAGLNPVLTVASYDADYVVQDFNNLPFCDAPVPSTKANETDMAIDVFALGVNINVAQAGSTNKYVPATGTSASAALVAGAALQWISAHSSYSATQIRSVLANQGVPKGERLLDVDSVIVPTNKELDLSKITLSVISIPQADQLARPSGRLVDVAFADSANVDIDLNAQARNVTVLDFAPLSPWMSFDTATGIVNINPSSTANANIAPGVYNFGIRGEVSGRVMVEEYSVGVYDQDPSELTSASEYYYDTESQDYEQVVTFQGATLTPTNKSLNP
jgi:subtilisin family serine protease